MSSTVIYLVRHGETEWNTAGRYQGRLDSPLTARGARQATVCANILAAAVADVDQMYASPLGRARSTVSIIRSVREYPEVRWDTRLEEVSTGSWDGLTSIDIEAHWPGMLDGSNQFNWFFRSPDGESYDAAVARVDSWLREVSGVVVAVSHGLLGRLVRGRYLGLAREDALGLPVPQDVIWRLGDGEVQAIGA